jgi:hypothetical protein
MEEVNIMRKLTALFLALLLATAGFTQYALADDPTDSFLITITVGFIGINLLDWTGGDYGTWAIGEVGGSTLTTMEANSGADASEQGVHVDNTSNIDITLAAYASNSLGWTLITGASPSLDEYRMRIDDFAAWQSATYPDMASAIVITSEASPGETFSGTISSATDAYLYVDLVAPSEVTSGTQNTITVTIEASSI